MSRPIPRRRHGLRSRLAAGVSATLVAGLVAACSGAGSPTTPGTATPSPSASVAPSTSTQQNAPEPAGTREDELAELLAARAAAVRGHDRAAFAATLADPSSGFGLRQLAQ